MKKLIAGFMTALIFLLTVTSPVLAVTYDETTRIEIDDVDAYCYGEDAREIITIEFPNRNETTCKGSGYGLQACIREFKMENLDNKKNEFVIRALPEVEGLTCPPPSAPSKNIFLVSVAPNGDEDLAEHYALNMNECWGWWCFWNVTYTDTKCFFDLPLEDVPVLNQWMCRNVTYTQWNDVIDTCPSFIYKASPSDKWLNISWGWHTGNDYQVYTDVQIITLSTSRRSKVIETSYDELTKIQATQDVFKGSIGSLMLMNANFLSIIYSIAEVTIIVVSVIMLPVITLLVIKYMFEKVTGKPLTFSRRRRR